MTKRARGKKTKGFSFNDWIGIILLLGIPGYFIWTLATGHIRRRLLNSADVEVVIARINSEKEYLGNSPVTQAFYYKYTFTVDSQTFSGDSRDHDKQPGDTILVRYVISRPELNEPVQK